MPTPLGTTGVAPATHALVWVSGADAVTFLDSQLTQDVAGMAPGMVRRSLLLEPRGKLRAILWVLRDQERVGLVVPVAGAADLMADLARYRFRVDVDISRDARPVHTVWGGEATPAAGWSDDGIRLDAATPWYRCVAAFEPPQFPVLDAATAEARRIAAGEPQFGVEVDEGTIPQETGLVPESVSFTKGCYLGQELVARIDSRGHVNRVLRRLVGSGAPPHAGAAVTRDDAALGILGSVAPIDGGWAGLALLRREVGPGETVAVGGPGTAAVATVIEVVPSSHSSNPPER